MANLLYQEYNDRIFQIDFHRRHDSPKLIFTDYTGKEPVIIELIEDIMADMGNKPIGFDVFNSPFANIRDSRSYYFHFQPSVKMSDLYRGYIFLVPFKNISLCQWLDNYISGEMLEKNRLYYETRFKKKFRNAKEINDFFKR